MLQIMICRLQIRAPFAFACKSWFAVWFAPANHDLQSDLQADLQRAFGSILGVLGTIFRTCYGFCVERCGWLHHAWRSASFLWHPVCCVVEAARSAAEDHISLHSAFSSLAFSSYSICSFLWFKMRVLSGPLLIQVYRLPPLPPTPPGSKIATHFQRELVCSRNCNYI